jgi:hypothetical protein
MRKYLILIPILRSNFRPYYDEEYYNRTKNYSFLTNVFEEGVLLVGAY